MLTAFCWEYTQLKSYWIKAKRISVRLGRIKGYLKAMFVHGMKSRMFNINNLGSCAPTDYSTRVFDSLQDLYRSL